MATGRGQGRSSGPDPARAAAVRAIRRVTESRAYSNLAVPAELDRAGLAGRDRAFAADLAFGTVRRLIPIDAAIAQEATRPNARIHPEALALLRLGAYQILFSRVPPHAAVSD